MFRRMLAIEMQSADVSAHFTTQRHIAVTDTNQSGPYVLQHVPFTLQASTVPMMPGCTHRPQRHACLDDAEASAALHAGPERGDQALEASIARGMRQVARTLAAHGGPAAACLDGAP